jgi:hypothetical protein
MNNITHSMSMADRAATFYPAARSNFAMIQAVTRPSNISSTVTKASVPGIYASVVPTSGVQSLKGILAGSKMPWWAGLVIGVAIVAIVLGSVLISKLVKKNKNKMPDVETGSTQQSSTGSQAGKAFIARYFAVRRSIMAIIPGTSQVPTRDDIELAESPSPAAPVVPIVSVAPATPAKFATPVTLQHAHERTAT